MKELTIIIQKVIASILVFVMTMAQCAILGFSAVSYAVDMLATNSNNVEFKAYFKAENEETTTVDSNINSNDLKLQIDVAVKNEGYFNGQISLENAGFKFKEDSANEYIKKVENGIIYLEQINAEEMVKIEIGIEYLNEDNIQLSSLNSPTKVMLTGTYVSSKQNVEIRGESEVTVNWNIPENVSAQLSAKLLTNKVYKVNEINKRIIQIVVASKLQNNIYPIKNTQIQIDIPEGAELARVHKRTTSATNGDKEFTNENYYVENNKLIVNVENNEENGRISWNKNAQDTFVVTYEFPETIDLNNLQIKINGKITTYDFDNQFLQEISLNMQEKVISFDEEKDGIVSIDKKEQETEIYKGKLYANNERDYIVGTKLLVDYANVIDSIKLVEDNSVFIKEEKNDKDEKVELQKQANTEYVQTTINKMQFMDLFGEEGTIQITDKDERVLAYITKDTESDENGNIIIKYDKGIKLVNISTSKPQKDGSLTIINQKKILETGLNREEIQQLTKLNDISKLKYNNDSSIVSQKQSSIELKETESKIDFNIENNTLISSKEQQKMQMSVILNTNGENRDLYKNPIIKVKLPTQVKNILPEVQLLYGNGLEKEKVFVEDENGQKVIVIKLKGEQINYPGEAVTGSTILINANVTLNEIKEDTIGNVETNYTNENAIIYSDDGKQISNINIIYKKQETLRLPVVKAKAIQVDSNSEINATLKAEVGEDEIEDGDEVKAGEIIKYTLNLSNDGNTSIENMKVIATIPNNTKLLKINPEHLAMNERNGEKEDGEGSIENVPYFVESDDTQLTKENLNIEAKKSVVFTYYVKVNPELNGEAQGKTIVTIEHDEKTVTEEISSNFIEAPLAVLLSPMVRTEGNNQIKSGLISLYKLTIYNSSNEDKANVEVTLNKNDLLQIGDIDYVSGDYSNSYKDGNLTFQIPSIAAKDTAYIEISAKVGNYAEENAITKISAIVKDSEQNVYRSNKIEETIIGAQLSATLESSNNTENYTGYVHPGDKIKYTIKVSNTSSTKANSVSIKDRISDYLKLESISLNGNECEYTQEAALENSLSYTDITISNISLNPGEIALMEIIAKVDDLSSTEVTRIENQAFAYNEGILLAETEKNVYNIQVINNQENEIVDNTQNNESVENPDGNPEGNPDDSEGGNSGGNSGENSENDSGGNGENNSGNDSGNSNPGKNSQKYIISGIVWLDENRNGSRDSEEKVLEGIKVYAINISNNKIVTDTNGNQITSTTNSQGIYTLSNMPKGEYLIAFEYDTGKYIVTTYQADGINSDRNSDAVKAERIVEGETKELAITDSIKLNNSIANIDLGLIEAKTFDLELKKSVSKIIVTNNDGTKTYNFDDTDLAKVEIASKYLRGSNVVIEYKIKIKNNGEIAGYVKNIVDYIPSSLTFNSTLNKNWYKKGNYIYTENLANTKIEPGETKEVKLILTKKMTESNTGLINNKAEIQSAYNDLGIRDINSTPGNKEENENDLNNANVIIGVKTGVAISYILLTISIVTLISVTAYFVSMKIHRDKI